MPSNSKAWLFLCHLPLYLLPSPRHLRLRGLLSDPSIQQVHSWLRTIALAVPSILNTLPPDFCKPPPSLHSGQLRCDPLPLST